MVSPRPSSTSVLAVTVQRGEPDIFMNALTAGFDNISAVSIPAKSLETSYNTIANVGCGACPSWPSFPF